MAPRQEGQPDPEEDERARFRDKLDSYEAMGLEVGALRELLERDLESFKQGYLKEITRQLEGEIAEPSPEIEEPVEVYIEPPAEVPEPVEPEETLTIPSEPEEGPPREIRGEEEETPETADLSEEETEEVEGPTPEDGPPEAEEDIIAEMELELEGAGPEVALAAIDEEEELPGVEEEEGLEIAIGIMGPGEQDLEEETEEPEQVEEVEEPAVAPEEEAMIMVAAEPDEGVEETEEEAEEEEAEVIIFGIRPEEREAEQEDEEILPPTEGPEEEEPLEEEVLEEEVLEEGPVAEEPTVAKIPRAVKIKKPVAEAPPPKAPARPAKPPTEPAKKEPAKPPVKPATRPAAKRARPSPKTISRRRRGLPRAALAAIVVVMIVIASLASYFLFIKNEDPRPYFIFDPDNPQVGELIKFDAGQSVDPDGDTIGDYTWDFGDGNKAKGRIARHAFLSSETFDVKLTVKDDKNGEGVVRRSVSVDPLTTSMAAPMEGDAFEYDVKGNASLWNSDGLYRYEVEGLGEIVIQEILVRTLSGTRTSAVTQVRTAIDGYMRSHDVRVELTEYDLRITDGQVFTNIQIDPSFTGSIEATVEEDVCLEWDRTIRSKATMDTMFSAYEFADFSSHDDGTFYGQLDAIDDTFSMEAFLRATEFSSEDRGTHNLPVAGGTYLWRVLGMERVAGVEEPGLHINMTMDSTTLAKGNLDQFFTDVWIVPGLSQPAKTHLFVKGRQEANRFRIQLTETLRHHTTGDGPIPTSCSADHGYSAKEAYSEDFRTLQVVPERGGTGGGFKFSPKDALDAARADIPDLDLWLASHPSAFMHMGNYSDRGTDARWVMALGEDGSQEHYRVTVRGTETTITSTDAETFIDASTPFGDPASIGEVVTLTRGLRLMREESEVASRCFVGSNPDWTRYTFNVSESVPLLSMDPSSALVTAQEDGYIYSLVGKDGRHRAALDATNGQVLYTWTHTQTFDNKLEGLT